MKRKITIGLGVLLFLLGISIYKFNRDEERALFYRDSNAISYANLLRLPESSYAVADYYKPEHEKNLKIARQFAIENIGHYGSLFKNKLAMSERDFSLLPDAEETQKRAMSVWYNVDPNNRYMVYQLFLNTLKDEKTKKNAVFVLTSIHDNPEAYNRVYSKDQYELTIDSKNPKNYMTDAIKKVEKQQKAKQDKLLREQAANMIANEEPSGEDTTTAGKDKDERFTAKLDKIALALTKATGYPYHAGVQAVPRVPSDYPKNTKVYEVEFAHAGDTETGNDIYTVKLKYNAKTKDFIITNLKDLPDSLNSL